MNDNSVQTEKNSITVDDEAIAEPKRRRWIWFALVGVVLAAAVFAVVVLLLGNGSSTEAAESDALNFAEVVTADLIQEETFNGIIGSIEDDPVKTMLGGTITGIPESGDIVSQGEALFAIDDEPVVLLYGDQPAYRDITIGEDMVTISSPPDGTITWVVEPGTVIQQGDQLYRVDDQPVIALYGAQPAYRDIAIVTGGGDPDETVTILNQLEGTITWVAEPGTVIQQGGVLYRVDDQPVIAMYGDQPAYRDLYNSLGSQPDRGTI
jgi:hypothetical protein